MKAILSKKVIISILGLSSIVLVGTAKDYHSRSAMLEGSDSVATQISSNAERSLASEAVARVAQMYLPPNLENIKKINTTWEIVRIVGSDEKVSYDKLGNREDAKKSLKVTMELIGNGIVRVSNDNQQVYRVSLLSDFGTIALFKMINGGYEILEAKKIASSEESQALQVEGDVELTLERALNQAKSNKVLEKSEVSGEVSLSAKKINNLSVQLTYPNGETQALSIGSTDILDGGAFQADVDGEEVTGVVLNNGKDGYRISFATGPLAGSMLNFVTKEQLDQISEVEQSIQADNNDQQVEEVQMAAPAVIDTAAEQVAEERKEAASNLNPEPVEVLSADEIKETVAENGFAF